MTMPTLKQIIGSITGKLAFERTQENFTIIKDAHNALESNLTTHEAENMMQVKRVSRDLKISGKQIITFDKPIKGVTSISGSTSSNKISFGGISVNNGVITMAGAGLLGTYYFFTGSRIIAFYSTSLNYTFGEFVISGNNLEINWTVVGTGADGLAETILTAYF